MARSGAAASTAPGVRDGDEPEPGLLDADALLERIAERLADRFPHQDGELVTRVVRESCTALGRTARVTQHLPVLAERFAVQRLEDIARVEGEA